MAFNLRIPAAMDSKARSRAAELGISINAFVLIALDAYIKSQPAQSSPMVITGITPSKAKTAPDKNLTKSDRARIHNLRYELQKAKQGGLDLLNP